MRSARPKATRARRWPASRRTTCPTLRGWWCGSDIEVRENAGVCSSEAAAGWRTLRAEERHALLARLVASGLVHDSMLAAYSTADELPDEICVAVHRLLARTPSRLVAVQLEDLAGITEQANLPGTIDEYPNWRRRLDCDLEELALRPQFHQHCAGHGGRAAAAVMNTPRATYRIQFRNGMTFARAEALAPYFARLGVSHLYASPIFAAVPESTHGYDAIDMKVIEPSLGSETGFREMAETLRRHGMGIVLDFVPNHMGANPLNAWWRDVLEWGAAASPRPHFDVDWSAPKLIVPALADPYGVAPGERGFQPRVRSDGRNVLVHVEWSCAAAHTAILCAPPGARRRRCICRACAPICSRHTGNRGGP